MSKRSEAAAAAQQEEPTRINARQKALILKAVADKHGVLTAELVVRESDPGNAEGIAHALAAAVGWNRPDEEAARRWREDQARAVIRSVEPELIQMGVVELRAPFYVSDPAKGAGQQGYVRLMSLKTEEEVAEDAMQAEIRRAVAALERAYTVAVALQREESAGIFAALAALGRAPAGVPSSDGGSVLASAG
jgi:hypothetical protein